MGPCAKRLGIGFGGTLPHATTTTPKGFGFGCTLSHGQQPPQIVLRGMQRDWSLTLYAWEHLQAAFDTCCKKGLYRGMNLEETKNHFFNIYIFSSLVNDAWNDNACMHDDHHRFQMGIMTWRQIRDGMMMGLWMNLGGPCLCSQHFPFKFPMGAPNSTLI